MPREAIPSKDVHVRVSEPTHKEARIIAAGLGVSVATIFEFAYKEHAFHVGVRGVLELLSQRDKTTRVTFENKEYLLSDLLSTIATQLENRKLIVFKEE